jgi:hypothetical protein
MCSMGPSYGLEKVVAYAILLVSRHNKRSTIERSLLCH